MTSAESHNNSKNTAALIIKLIKTKVILPKRLREYS